MITTIELGKLTRPLAKGQIVIPKEYLKALKISPRSLLKILMIGDNLVITPLKTKRELKSFQKIETYPKQEINRILAEDKSLK